MLTQIFWEAKSAKKHDWATYTRYRHRIEALHLAQDAFDSALLTLRRILRV